MKATAICGFSFILAIVAISACVKTETAAPPPVLTQEAKDLAIQVMTDYPNVIEAAAGQQGGTLSLAVVVSYGTSQENAKQAGDNFVRLVKTFGPKNPPGQAIGPGRFDYLVVVVYPDETIIAQGAKVMSASHITW